MPLACNEMSQPEELHEWISFADPELEQTWLIDATFLRSNWTCIYGNGCQGVLDDPAPDLHQGCCSHGAHFIDKEDLASVKKFVKRLTPEHWQNFDKGRNNKWLTKEKDGSNVTATYKRACIFHNRPDFEGGMGCAFHVAASAAKERPMDWKPDVCWQVPLRLEQHDEDENHILSIVREWKRRDWGGGGHDFHWWCTDDSAAFVGSRPVYKYLKDELIELCGDEIYEIIVKQLQKPRTTFLPHPQVRQKTRS